MNEQLVSEHIGNLTSDYVLDLLPQEDMRNLSRHLKHCVECRQMVAAEEGIGFLVRSTIEASGQSKAHLSALMPKIPVRRDGLLGIVSIRQQLAVTGIVLILLFAGFYLMFGQDMGGYTVPASTAYVATASHTSTPIAATSSPTPKIRTYEAAFQSSPNPIRSYPLITPAPSALDAR